MTCPSPTHCPRHVQRGKCTVYKLYIYSQNSALSCSTTVHYHTVQCNFLQCNTVYGDVVQFVLVCVQCFLHCSTVLERYSSVFNMVWHNVWTWLLSIRMVRRLHIAPGRNQNHYTTIYQPLLKDHQTKLFLEISSIKPSSHAKADILWGVAGTSSTKVGFSRPCRPQIPHIILTQEKPFRGERWFVPLCAISPQECALFWTYVQCKGKLEQRCE